MGRVELQELSISPRDAQFIEARELLEAVIIGLFQWPTGRPSEETIGAGPIARALPLLHANRAIEEFNGSKRTTDL